jgi:predicted membrane protein
MSDALPTPGTRLQWPSLATALAIMLAGTLYPPLLANAAGQADHGLASLWLLAMSAGFVRGVGFVPRFVLWRLLFSGWTCALALLAALALRWLP